MSERKTFKRGKWTIDFSRFPNQGYGWFPHKNGKGEKAILNSKGSRFGAGWDYKLGFSFSRGTLLIDALFGIIRISRSKV